jgi:hypothetical protein
MLDKKLDPANVGKYINHRGPFWKETLWVFIFSLTFIALFPIGAAGQAAAPGATAPAQAGVLGTGAQTPLRFAGESVPENQASLSFGTSAFYDDNVLSTGTQRLGDEAVSFNSRLGISRRTEHVTINFDYMPFFMLYRQIDQFDRLNHTANLGLTFQLTSRFSLGLHDTFSYQNGVYPALTGQQILSGPVSPTALNQMIFSPTTRTLSNMSGLDLMFIKSRRTSLTLSGGYDQRKFGNQGAAGQPLYNDTGVSGSLQYQYRVTENTSFGFLVVHQDSTYQGGQAFGYRQRSQIESASFSVGSRLSPTVTVTVFGGPQYIRTIGQSSVGISIPGAFQGSGGGSITKEVGKTALNLSLQRSVSDGGGLYTSAINTNATFGIRRRLVGRWETDLHGGAARSDASLFQNVNGKTDTLMGGIDFSRPLGGGAVFHVSYDTTHQLSKGSLPVSASLDRNQVTIGFDYQFKPLPLGR